MRARRFRPSFDSLDIRLVLDSGAGMVSGGNLASTVLGNINPNGSTSDPDLTGVINWYQDGTPPPDSDDPSDAPLDWALLPST